MHAQKILGKNFNSDKIDDINSQIANNFEKINILSTKYDNSVENDKTKQYSLNKLIEASNNNTPVYDNDLSALYSNLGTLTHPFISNSIPWLTYLNSIIIAVILIRTLKLPNPFPLIYSPNLPKATAKSIDSSCLEIHPVKQADIYLDFIVTICLIILIVAVIRLACKKRKHSVNNSTTFKLTLISPKGEIILDFGKTLCAINKTTMLYSDTPDCKPTFALSHKLEIDWQKYLLKTGEGKYKLPVEVKLLPWQITTLREIIPELTLIQISAVNNLGEPLSWQIFM
jgi:hypothetical protein